MIASKVNNFFKLLGPGLVYAGAAVGVSHLVQSTRAGALFSFELVIFVLLANFLKLPFLEMGVRYPQFSGKSLLHGYEKLGRHYLLIFLLITILTMFVVMAAISVVTAGITLYLFPASLSASVMAIILLAFAAIMLVIGKYDLLDNLVKYIVILLSFATLTALALSLTKFDFSQASFVFNDFRFDNKADLLFLMALIGWMPAPVDISVWQSLWTCERNAWKVPCEQKQKEGRIDFYVGYIGTAILALCFLGLGAIIMKPSGEGFSGSAVVFSGQLVELFSKSIGDWSKWIIGFACLATMLSTTMTCLDAFPRVLSRGFVLLNKKENKQKFYYQISLIAVVAGSSLVLIFFLKSMKLMVDFATTISFLITPIIGWMNWKLFRKYIKNETRFDRFIDKVGIIGLCFFSIFFVIFLFLKF